MIQAQILMLASIALSRAGFILPSYKVLLKRENQRREITSTAFLHMLIPNPNSMLCYTQMTVNGLFPMIWKQTGSEKQNSVHTFEDWTGAQLLL